MAASGGSHPVPIIRFVKDGGESDLEAVPKSVREHIYKSYLQQNVAILVSDMSGFTRLTRKYGIIHFASIIARIRQLFLPYFHKNGAMVITTEADTFNVIFPSVDAAVKAALCMQRITKLYNESLSADRSHFSLPLEGVGIDFGPGPLLDKAGKLIGNTFNHAHELGEELCKGNMIAMSSAAKKEIEGSPDFSGAEFQPLEAPPDSEEIAEALNDMGGAFELRLKNIDACGTVELVTVDDDRYLQPALLPFARRHSTSAMASELERVDAQLKETHMSPKVALMFTIACENAKDPQSELRLKYDCLQRLSSVFARHNADAAEDVLYFFKSPVDAILCALECRRAMRKLEQQVTDKTTQPWVSIRGYGIHTGDVLMIDGTDIHWGDPVNTSSKLGQEIAAGEEVIISQPTFDACQGDPRLKGLNFHQIHVTLSGVQFHPYKVFDEALDDPKGQNAAEDVEALRSSILEKFKKSGLLRDAAAIDRSVLLRLLKALDPSFAEADFETIISHIGRGRASDVSLPDFLDWALETAREG